jgi:hypothetical protein
MRTVLLLLLVSGCLSLPSVTGQPATPERVAKLIQQLGSTDFDEREAATRALDTLGAPAMEALREATQSSDLEVRRQAQDLGERIQRRVESADALTPSRVHLIYKDTPLTEALADFGRKTGYVLRLADGQPPLANRTVTLDTGPTTFWQAFDRFCLSAGVKEQTEQLVVEPRRRPIPINRPGPEARFVPREIILVDGRSEQPTHYAGNLVIRTLSPAAALDGLKKAPDEALLGLEVLAEPALQARGVLGVIIERAIDDRGQILRQRQGAPERKEMHVPDGGSFIIGGVPLDFSGLDNPDFSPRRAPVRLALGEKPSAVLKEVRGTVVTQVRTPSRPLATVEDVLKAANQTVAGVGGSSAKVVTIERKEDGTVKLVALFEPPQPLPSPEEAELERIRAAFRRGGVNIRGTIVIGNRAINLGDPTPTPEEPWTANNFALLDGQGKPFSPVKVTATGKTTGRAREFELIYRPEVGQGEATRLIFSAPRMAVVDVPFVLKDVPLP